MLDSILYFFKRVLVLTTIEVLWAFSSIIIFGFLLYMLANRTRVLYCKTLGTKGELYITGFIGVPIHELGHLIFCIIFRHRIDDVKLLDIRATNGVLGYVNHSYRKDSIYQNIGNFFIGVGPIIFATIILYILLTFMLPSLKEDIFSSILGNIHHSINSITFQSFEIENGGSILSIFLEEIQRLKILFFAMITTMSVIMSAFINTSYTTSVLFWLFIYLSICIASHMELSPQDISHVTRALLVIVVFMLLINSIWIFMSEMGVLSFIGKYINVDGYAYVFTSFLAMLQSILVFSLVMSFVNFIISALALNIVNIVIKKRPLGI